MIVQSPTTRPATFPPKTFSSAAVVVDFSDTVSENTSKKDANGFPKERSPILLLLSDYLL